VSAQTIKLAGKRFVILPESEYRALREKKTNGRARTGRRASASAQDLGDIAEAKRRRREPTVALASVRARLGL
jgi:hypothetical protein